MCQSYKRTCACGERTAELFFGKNVLNESAVREVYCPTCASRAGDDPSAFVQDNGWVIQLDPDLLKSMASHMGLDSETVTADAVFSGHIVSSLNHGISTILLVQLLVHKTPTNGGVIGFC